MGNDTDYVGFLARHQVALVLNYESSPPDIITTCVVKFGEEWYLMTAGHCLAFDTEASVARRGKFTSAQLVDNFTHLSSDNLPVPINLMNLEIQLDGNEKGFDCGTIKLTPYYVNLLRASGIEPLTSEHWDNLPGDFDFYLLGGFPADIQSIEQSGLDVLGVEFLILDRLDEKPDGFVENPYPQFFGRILTKNWNGSVVGMSGGPIFGYKLDESNRLMYRILAIQSRWVPATKSTAGPLIRDYCLGKVGN